MRHLSEAEKVTNRKPGFIGNTEKSPINPSALVVNALAARGFNIFLTDYATDHYDAPLPSNLAIYGETQSDRRAYSRIADDTDFQVLYHVAHPISDKWFNELLIRSSWNQEIKRGLTVLYFDSSAKLLANLEKANIQGINSFKMGSLRREAERKVAELQKETPLPTQDDLKAWVEQLVDRKLPQATSPTSNTTE